MLLIDFVMSIPNEFRDLFLGNLANSAKKRIFDSIPTLTDQLALTNKMSVQERAKKRREYVEKYPNEIHWDWMEFYPCKLYSEKNNRESGIWNNVKVSNRGDVIYYHGANKRVFLNLNEDISGDTYNRVKLSGIRYAVHRVVGCMYCPLPEDHAHDDISMLVTNHKDTDRTNDSCYNLEWTTNGENVIHGFNKDKRKTGIEYFKQKYILLEVVADNRFKGRKYVINGLEQCESAGFKWASLRYVIDGSKSHNFGHKASYISAEEAVGYEQGIPDDIRELFEQNRNYFAMDIRPVIGKVLSGPLEGLEFSFFGATETKQYFVQANVMKVLSGERKQHGNCTWRYGTIEEGIALHNKLSHAELSSLNR